jgi:hypothetical protein
MSQLALPNTSYLQAEITLWRNKGFLLKLLRQVTILDGDKERRCFAYNRTLAAKLKVSPDTITRGLERLAAVGAVAIEHVVGLERRVAALLGVAELRAILFPKGSPTPVQRARIRAARCSFSRPQSTFFSDDVAEGSAETVAEGHIESLPSGDILYGTSCRETDSMRSAVKKPATVAPNTDPAVVSALCACLPEGDALSIAREASKSGWSLERVLGAIRAMRSTEGVKVAGAWLRAALRDGNWLPPAPPSNHASDRGIRPVRKPIVAPTPAPSPAKSEEKIDYVTTPERPAAAPSKPSAPVVLENVTDRRLAAILRARSGGNA